MSVHLHRLPRRCAAALVGLAMAFVAAQQSMLLCAATRAPASPPAMHMAGHPASHAPQHAGHHHAADCCAVCAASCGGVVPSGSGSAALLQVAASVHRVATTDSPRPTPHAPQHRLPFSIGPPTQLV